MQATLDALTVNSQPSELTVDIAGALRHSCRIMLTVDSEVAEEAPHSSKGKKTDEQ
ncbi:hypothetical protein GCM10010523_23390 [Paenarthrobacter ilicis]